MSIENIVFFLALFLGALSVTVTVNQILQQHRKISAITIRKFTHKLNKTRHALFKSFSFFEPNNFGNSPCDINKEIKIKNHLRPEQLFIEERKR